MGDDGGGGVFDANAELVNILDDILGSASEEDWIGSDDEFSHIHVPNMKTYVFSCSKFSN